MRQERTKSYSLAQNSLFNTAGMMTYYLCQWAMTMAAVRLSTEEDVGAMQLAMTVSNIFISLANYNMRTFQISDIRGEYAAGHYVAARLITCGAAMACSIVYSLLWGYSAQSLITIGLYMLYRMNESLADVLHGIDQRHERLDHVMVSGTVRGVSMLAVFTAVLWLTKSMIAAIAAIAAITLAEVVLYDLRAAARYESVRPRFEKAKLVRLLTVCLPGVIASVCFTAVVSVPRQYLAELRGEVLLGYYATIATPLMFVQTLANSLMNPSLGRIAEAADRHDRRAYTGMIGKMLLMITGLTLACLGGVALLGEPVMTLIYGEKIRSYVPLMFAVAGCTGLYAAGCLGFNLLVIERRMKELLIISAGALGISALTGKAMITLAGANGVSYTVMAAYLAFAVITILLPIARIGRGGAKHDIRPEETDGI